MWNLKRMHKELLRRPLTSAAFSPGILGSDVSIYAKEPVEQVFGQCALGNEKRTLVLNQRGVRYRGSSSPLLYNISAILSGYEYNFWMAEITTD